MKDSASPHYLVLGLITALVAHNMEAVSAFLAALAVEEPQQAAAVGQALARGLAVANKGAHA